MKKATFFLCAIFLFTIGYLQGSETVTSPINPIGDKAKSNSLYHDLTKIEGGTHAWIAKKPTISDRSIVNDESAIGNDKQSIHSYNLGQIDEDEYIVATSFVNNMGYCEVSTNYESDYLSSIRSFSAFTNFSYTATSFPNNSY